MTAAVEAVGLGKRYGRRWALSDCTLSMPAGRVVGLVGPNGAGKTTLLHLAVGLLAPTTGEVKVLGHRPGGGPEALGSVGFLAQDSPAYSRLTVGQHLQMGAWLNPRWDGEWATGRVRELGLDVSQRAGTLSGGQGGGRGPGLSGGGRDFVGRAAGTARIDPRGAQAPGAVVARGAGGEPG